MSKDAKTSWMLSRDSGAWPAGAGAGLFRNALSDAPRSAPSPLRALFSFSTCAEHFCQIGPNGLKFEKETTHFIVRWTRVV